MLIGSHFVMHRPIYMQISNDPPPLPESISHSLQVVEWSWSGQTYLPLFIQFTPFYSTKIHNFPIKILIFPYGNRVYGECQSVPRVSLCVWNDHQRCVWFKYTQFNQNISHVLKNALTRVRMWPCGRFFENAPNIVNAWQHPQENALELGRILFFAGKN